MIIKKNTRLLIILVSFILVFICWSQLETHSLNQEQLRDFFWKGILHPRLFSLFEIIVIVLCLNLIINYKYTSLKITNFLFLFAFIAFVFRIINPNTGDVFKLFGLPLLSSISDYLFLFMLLTFLSISKNLLKKVLDSLFYYVFVFSTISLIFLLTKYIFAMSTITRFGNISLTLNEPETQFLFSFLGAISFSIYLIYKKNKFLYFAILFLLVTFLSLQRSTFIPGLLAIIFVAFTIILKGIPRLISNSFKLTLAAIFLLLSVFAFAPESNFSFAINRMIGMSKSTEEARNIAFSDTGHWGQANLVFASILKQSPFWGIGYGNWKEDMYLEGQSSLIHNAYASIWKEHGIITLLFYLFIILVVVRHTIRIIKIINVSNYKKYLIKLTACFYFLGYCFTGWFTLGSAFTFIRAQVFWLPIFIFIIRYPIILEDSKNHNRIKKLQD